MFLWNTGFMDPNYTTVSCASSTNALIDAKMLLQLGKADVIVCGGSELLLPHLEWEDLIL